MPLESIANLNDAIFDNIPLHFLTCGLRTIYLINFKNLICVDILKCQFKFCLLFDFLPRFLTNLASTGGPHEISRRAACGPRAGQHAARALHNLTGWTALPLEAFCGIRPWATYYPFCNGWSRMPKISVNFPQKCLWLTDYSGKTTENVEESKCHSPMRIIYDRREIKVRRHLLGFYGTSNTFGIAGSGRDRLPARGTALRSCFCWVDLLL